jgi:transposase InsO family protein
VRASQLKQSARPPGRPGATPKQRRDAIRAIACLDRMDWHLTWRDVKAAIGDRIPTRLLQEATATWKRHRLHRAERRCANLRMHVDVHAREVIWALDGTHLGRTSDAAPIESEVLRDVHSRRTLDLAVGAPACGQDVVQILERARERHGALPLVFSSDNGPINTSAEVEDYLGRHRIVHLRNVPRTPQHNPFVERAIGELKQMSGLGKGVVLADAHDAALRLARAWHHLDHRHARPALRHRTAAACYQNERARYSMQERELF